MERRRVGEKEGSMEGREVRIERHSQSYRGTETPTYIFVNG
jgi:hypothetical protein